jgi:hypothetical protein
LEWIGGAFRARVIGRHFATLLEIIPRTRKTLENSKQKRPVKVIIFEIVLTKFNQKSIQLSGGH